MTAHPADVDGAQSVGALTWSRHAEGQEVQLPYTVDSARLEEAAGSLWAVRCITIHQPDCCGGDR